MKRSRWITAVVLALVALGIVAALILEATSGPTFRAEDYPDHAACLAGIPAEWRLGSLERSGAEDACRYAHLRRAR